MATAMATEDLCPLQALDSVMEDRIAEAITNGLIDQAATLLKGDQMAIEVRHLHTSRGHVQTQCFETGDPQRPRRLPIHMLPRVCNGSRRIQPRGAKRATILGNSKMPSEDLLGPNMLKTHATATQKLLDRTQENWHI